MENERFRELDPLDSVIERVLNKDRKVLPFEARSTKSVELQSLRPSPSDSIIKISRELANRQMQEQFELEVEMDKRDGEEALIQRAFDNGGAICMKPKAGHKMTVHQNPSNEGHVVLQQDPNGYEISRELTPDEVSNRLWANREFDINHPCGPYSILATKAVEIPVLFTAIDGEENVIKYTADEQFPFLTDEVGRGVAKLKPRDFYEAVKDSPAAEVMGVKNDEIAVQSVGATHRVEASRKRRPVADEPLSARARIEQRTRKFEVFENIFGVSRRFDNEVNASRQFHLLMDQREDLETARVHLLAPNGESGSRQMLQNIMMPFEKFSIVIDNSDYIEAVHDCDEDCRHAPDLFPDGTVINLYKPCGYLIEGSHDTKVWYVHEKFISRNDWRDMHLYLSLKIDFAHGTIEFPSYDIQQNTDNLDTYREIVQGTLAFIINFLLVLNHRKVKVVDVPKEDVVQRPSNRQQRRSQGWVDTLDDGNDRPHWKIHIPATQTLYNRLSESIQGINVNERREHDVRGHLRTDKYGRKRIQVKNHKRCRGSAKPYFQRNYDAANVGMEY